MKTFAVLLAAVVLAGCGPEPKVEPQHKRWCLKVCTNHGGALYVHISPPWDEIECVCDEFRSFDFNKDFTPLWQE